PELPAEIDAFVLWLLEKDPAARPASAAEVIRAVDHLAAMVVPIAPRGAPPSIQSVIRNATAPTRLPMGITTLGSAASAVTLLGAHAGRRRTPGVAAVAGAVVALLATLVVARVRGGDASAAAAALPAPPAAPTATVAATASQVPSTATVAAGAAPHSPLPDA